MGRWGIGVALILAAGVSAAKDGAGRTLEVWVSPAAVRLDRPTQGNRAPAAARQAPGGPHLTVNP